MSSQRQTTSTNDSSSDVDPSPVPLIAIFELNQATREKVSDELETLRSAFLEWPTVEGFEAFVEKRLEYGKMMERQVADLGAVIREHVELAKEHDRADKLAKERRLLDPAKA